MKNNPLDGKTVIVVDDDPDIVDVFSDYLASFNAKILGVGFNGKEAVDLYSKHKPDYVFLDVMMNDYDGFYALCNIKKLEPSSTVILVTGDLTKETEMRAT